MRYSRMKNFSSFMSVFCIFSTLSACGGGSSSGGTAVVTDDTDGLVRNAARTISSNVGVNMNSIQSTTDNSSVVNTFLEGDAADTSSDENSSETPDFNGEQAFGHEQIVRDIVIPTIEGGNAQRTRNGNVITIDPDEQFVCQQWSNTDLIDNEDVQNCIELLQNLSVRIDADTDNSGQLIYLYSDQNLLQIDYGPNAGSYELFLSAAKLVIQRDAEINGNLDPVPEVMKGAIKLNANVFSSAFGQESGELSLVVSQAIKIESATDNINFQLGNTSSFYIDTDVGEDEGNVAVKIVDMILSMPDLAGVTPDAVTTVEIPEFSIDIELNESGSEMRLTDTGFGMGPMTIRLDNQLLMSLALAKTSMMFNESNGSFSFLKNLDFDLRIPDLHQLTNGEEPVNSNGALALTAAAGTTLQWQENGSMKVQTGGPFTVDYSYLDGDTNSQVNESFLQGECFSDTENSELARVNCD